MTPRFAAVVRKSYEETAAGFDWQDVRSALGWNDAGRVSLGEAIVDRHAGSDRTALIWVGTDGRESRLSYRGLSEASNRFAAALRRLGVQPGDRVAGLMPRVPETLPVIIGALKVGAIYVPMFTGFGPEAVRFRLDHSKARVVVTHTLVRDQIPSDIDAIVICVRGDSATLIPGDHDYEEAISRETPLFEAPLRDRDDTAALIYTSGSTGQPKGGAIAVNFLAAVWPYITFGLDLQPDDVLWPTGDPGWGYGFVCYLGALARGTTLVSLQSNPTPEVSLSIIERYGVTNLATTPTLLRGLMAHGIENVGPSRGKLRAISSCGEPLNAKVVEFFRDAWRLTPMDHFGATELALPIGNYNALKMDVKAGSMGLPSPGYQMAIVDEIGNVLPSGAVGLLASRSTTDNRYWLNYWEDPTASAELVRNGWIVTGDLAVRDDDGYFWFEGREGDMIKSAGYRIGPFEVESALLRHPAVAEAAVVGKPDELRGEIVKAWIVLRDGISGSDALSQELVELVRSTLGKYQYPREIAYVANLPKTETGKIQRFMLRQRALGETNGSV
jgi:acetyl-CoA synthetase